MGILALIFYGVIAYILFFVTDIVMVFYFYNGVAPLFWLPFVCFKILKKEYKFKTLLPCLFAPLIWNIFAILLGFIIIKIIFLFENWFMFLGAIIIGTIFAFIKTLMSVFSQQARDEFLMTLERVNNRSFEQKRRSNPKNIDLNIWKSQFVNQILEDSLTIKSLDSYEQGAWFSYSFEVSDMGEISNITVKSTYLNDMDKNLVIQLIQNYQYQDITVFPVNIDRKTIEISAVVLLSDETKGSTPDDFKNSL